MMFEQLRSDFDGISVLDKMVVRSMLLNILIFLLRETDGLKKRKKNIPVDSSVLRHSDLMEKAKVYIEKNYASAVTLDNIASALCVSPYHLCHVFSMTSEFSLFTYLTSIRMEKARLLLKEGGLNIKEIAARVGYDSASYFGRVFRKTIGWTPREYAAQFLLGKRGTREGKLK